jgi:predicted dehydrogenase
MHILSEKPIADTLPDANAILAAVTGKSLKMTITQNYRPEVPIRTLKKVLQSGELGRLNYIVARLANDYRKPMSWGVDHVHTRDNPLLVEGAVHQLDMLRNLSGSNCETIAGLGWNPEWSSFKGNPSNLLLLQMENGVKAVYEGNQLAAGQLNTWFRELYRVECEKGSAVVDRDQTVRVYRRNEDGRQIVEEVPPVELSISGHQAIVQDFLNWLDGGPPTETRLEDNIHSVAMVYAAMAATTEGGVRKVSDYLPG